MIYVYRIAVYINTILILEKKKRNNLIFIAYNCRALTIKKNAVKAYYVPKRAFTKINKKQHYKRHSMRKTKAISSLMAYTKKL